MLETCSMAAIIWFKIALFVAVICNFYLVRSIELEKCMGDTMTELQCKAKIKDKISFCHKGPDGDYDFARAYCCRTCIVDQGWIKNSNGAIPDYERPEAKDWLRPQGPKEDGTWIDGELSLTPWCELMKTRLKSNFCTQTHYALKCKKTCDVETD